MTSARGSGGGGRRRPRRTAKAPPEKRYITVATLYGASDQGESMHIDFVVDADEALATPRQMRPDAWPLLPRGIEIGPEAAVEQKEADAP